jgi:branched-chain amino acid transport system permease protein
MALSTVILFAVAVGLSRTRTGKAMRAVSDDIDLAESSGIDVRRVFLFVWIGGGALAATGGIFLGTVDSVQYEMGFRLLLLMFASVILGGLGTAYGAMLGSLVVGLVTEVSTLWVSPELKLVFALAALIIVLLVRPQGILGSRERVG